MIVLYDTNYTHNSNAYLARSVLRGAEAAFAGEPVILAGNETLMSLAAGGDCRALICIDGQRLRTDILQRVRPCFETMILWAFEDPFLVENNRQVAPLFDHIFTNDPECADVYGGKGRYLPLAACKEKDFRFVASDAELEFDIFFAGTMWPNRTVVVDRLVREFGDKRLKLVCPTNEYLPPLPRAVAERSIDRPVNHSAFVDFANRSRVVLTIYRDYTSGGGSSKANAPGPRYFETALAGAPQVIAIDPTSSSQYFDTIPGNVLCRSNDEIFEAIRAILSRPDDRERRATASQQAALQSHLYEHRLATMRDVIGKPKAKTAVAARRTKCRVVFCTHSVKTGQHIGGVEIYQDLVGGMLGDDFELFYWLRTHDRCQLLDQNLVALESFTSPAIGWLDVLTDPHEESLFSATMTSYGIDVVHFHHLGHHAASLPIVAKALGLGVLFSAHDFFLVCSRYNLLDYQSRYCDIAKRSILACNSCLRLSEGVQVGAQQTRRAFMGRVVDSIDMVLFGTKSSKDLVRKIYPRLREDQCEVPGVLNNHLEVERDRRTKDSGKSLNIAVLGNVLRSKGADCLLRIIELVRGSEDYVFNIFGKADDTYRDVLNRMSGPSIRFLDGYRNADVEALASCDVALFLSIWPETFSLSLSEAWQAGMIPIASNIGAFADRIEHDVNGFLVDVGDEAAIVALLQRLKCNPGIVKAMRRSLSSALWPAKEEHVGRLRALYRQFAPKVAMSNKPVRIDAGQIGLLPHHSWKEQAPPRHILEADAPQVYALSSDLLDADLVFEDAIFFLDGIADRAVETIANRALDNPLPVTISGWAFGIGDTLAGRIQVALVGETQAIFLDCVRHARGDVRAVHPQAPEYCGFRVDTRFHGRWSDGLYQIVILNKVGARTYVMMPTASVGLADGVIVEVMAEAVDAQQKAFVEARLKGEAAALPATSDPRALPKVEGDPLARLDEVRCAGNGSPSGVFRGWFYHPAMNADAASMYIGLRRGKTIDMRRIPRRDRADVKEALEIAELRTGFNEELAIPADTPELEVHLMWSDGVCSASAVFAAEVRGQGIANIRRL